jgi:MinD superfamily P-loop ATPase
VEREKMNLSRKDFFKKSLMSLGEAVLTVSDALKGAADVPMAIPDTANYTAKPQEDLVAVAHNEHCLAKNSGCFACVERCETRAIKLIPGVGIRINPQFCTGCGTCEYVCPVAPKAVTLHKRQTE